MYQPGPDIIAALAGRDATDDRRAGIENLVIGLIRQRLLDLVRKPAPAHGGNPLEAASP
jgi:hypothetical protein